MIVFLSTVICMKQSLSDRYYEVSLALLGTSLILQILVGIVALGISNSRNYLEKYNEDGRQQICENICHCKLVRRSKQKSKTHTPTKSHSKVGKGGLKIEDFIVVVDDDGNKEGDSDDEHCCPWVCTTQIYEKHESEILNNYYNLMPSLIHTELEMIRANERIPELNQRIGEIQKEEDQLEALVKEGKAEANKMKEYQSTLGTLSAERVKLTEEKRGFDKCLLEGNIDHKQNKLLYNYVDAITKNRVLKRATFWQGAINYMLYLIFVLNAFITGFGIANSSSSPNGTVIFILPNSTAL